MSQPDPMPCPPKEPEVEVPDEALPALETQEASFERTIDMARALPAESVQPLRVDVRLACANARAAYTIFVPYLPKARELAGADVAALDRLADLPGALLFAYRLVDLVDPPKRNLAPRLARARHLRFMLLHQAHAAVAAGLLPEKPVERIAAGRGVIDTAEDLVALAVLYKHHEKALHGRIVATPEEILEASQLGSALQEELQPAGAPAVRPSADELARVRDERNRMATLLIQSHRELQRVANYLGVEIPSLQSRKPLRKKAEAPPQ